MVRSQWSGWFGYALAASSMLYSVIAYLAVRLAAKSRSAGSCARQSVTILKPLCGVEPETYECLRSFCEQRYPHFQIVFGVCSESDLAIPTVRRLQSEYPLLELTLVIDGRSHGSNRKVSNLINMMAAARHEVLILADSDVRVKEDYLARVVGPLRHTDVGIVTCAYRGRARPGIWSALGAQFINEWFMPSVNVAAMGGSRSFAFGSTIAMRRDVLARIGGFHAIASQLADDYRLGELTRSLGLRTVLSDVVVDVCVVETGFGQLIHHELRWLRTIRALRPVGYGLSFVTLGTPVSLLGCLLAAGAPPTLCLLAITLFARLLLHLETRCKGEPLVHTLLLPVRDALTFGLWTWSFVTRRVRWRDHHYRVTRDGSAQLV